MSSPDARPLIIFAQRTMHSRGMFCERCRLDIDVMWSTVRMRRQRSGATREWVFGRSPCRAMSLYHSECAVFCFEKMYCARSARPPLAKN